MPDVHLRYSPSGASRWLNCPASLIHNEPSTTSEAAAEGTAAHKLAQQCWLLGVPPASRIGEEVDGFEVTAEMADAVQIYLDAIEATAEELDAELDQVSLEVFVVSKEFPDEFGGTVDCLIRTDKRTAIIDFKYGFQTVEVEQNRQLMCYAMLVAETPEVQMTIVQPRAAHADGPVRSWVASFDDDLLPLWMQIKAIIESGPDEVFSAGDHCQFCPRKKDCRELYQLSLQYAEEDFADHEMTPSRASAILGLRKALSGYLKAVEDWTHGQLNAGIEVPGFKLVHSYGNRRYCVDEDTVVRKCRSKKFGKKLIYETRLLSPAQLEKVVGKELVGSLVERPLKGTTVVPESDRRPAVEGVSIEEAFKDVN